MSRMTSSILRIQQSLDMVSGLDGEIALQVEELSLQLEKTVHNYIEGSCRQCEYCSKSKDVADNFDLNTLFCTEHGRVVSRNGYCSYFVY